MATTFAFNGILNVTPSTTDALDLVSVVDAAAIVQTFDVANGTAAGQANAYWRDVVTVAGGDAVSVDLGDLAANVYGGAGSVALPTQKIVVVRNQSETVEVAVSMGPSLAATLGPGGLLFATNLAAGWTETGVDIENAGASAADVEIYVVGVSS